jgi:hypothetical protein
MDLKTLSSGTPGTIFFHLVLFSRGGGPQVATAHVLVALGETLPCAVLAVENKMFLTISLQFPPFSLEF